MLVPVKRFGAAERAPTRSPVRWPDADHRAGCRRAVPGTPSECRAHRSGAAPTNGWRRGVSATAVTIGVTGQSTRSSVAPWGDVTRWGGDAPTLRWFVAADDRWHVPPDESTVRQRRIDGTPVVETRLRIPDGDAVQRVWAVADAGGVVVVEVYNDSPLPMAVAFAGAPVVTDRPPSHVAIQGIELPAGAIVMPVGHHAAVRVVAGPTAPDVTPARLPGADQVARGWLAVSERASKLDVPDVTLNEAVTAARCDLLLEGPVDAGDDPSGFVLDVAELVRLGEDAEAWLPEIVEPLERAARAGGPEARAAADAAWRVAAAGHDRRAAGDVERLRSLLGDAGPIANLAAVERGSSVGRFVLEIESVLATGGALLPAGIPTRWLGDNFAVHDVPIGDGTSVSYAIRWHGERPAVLWEQTGPPVTLTAPVLDPSWATDAPRGEALWPAPRRPTGLRVSGAIDG